MKAPEGASGLDDVVVAATELSLVDGEAGRLVIAVTTRPSRPTPDRSRKSGTSCAPVTYRRGASSARSASACERADRRRGRTT
jgi:hypothetical protein